MSPNPTTLIGGNCPSVFGFGRIWRITSLWPAMAPMPTFKPRLMIGSMLFSSTRHSRSTCEPGRVSSFPNLQITKRLGLRPLGSLRLPKLYRNPRNSESAGHRYTSILPIATPVKDKRGVEIMESVVPVGSLRLPKLYRNPRNSESAGHRYTSILPIATPVKDKRGVEIMESVVPV